MARKMTSISAVEGYFDGNWHGAKKIRGAGVTVAERRLVSIISLNVSKSDNRVYSAIESELGIKLSKSPGPVFEQNNTRSIWIRPSNWLLITEQANGCNVESQLRNVAPFAAVINITSGTTVFRVSGHSVRDVLSKGCSVDLHPQAFRVGTGLTTHMSHFTVILDSIGEDVIDIFVGRSFGLSCLDWILSAGKEFGCQLAESG